MKLWISLLVFLGLYFPGDADPITWGMRVDVLVGAFNYSVNIDGMDWLHSADTYVTLNNKVYSIADKTLKSFDISQEIGEDELGVYYDLSAYYHILEQGEPLKQQFVQVWRLYTDKDYALMGQRFIGDFDDATANNDPNTLSTSFPSFKADDSADLGYLAYGGIMFGDTKKKIGRWSEDSQKIESGLDSGPLVLFDNLSTATLIIAPFNHFMAQSAVYSQDASNKTVVSWGLLGSMKKIPDNTMAWTMLFYNGGGINKAFEEWGHLMRGYYKKSTAFRDADFTINYLGYWTDNGAYYYYKTEPNKTYEETILDVKTYADSLSIPYRYVQYDSWWYPKGPASGVIEWTSMKSVFPNGLQALWEKTGWPAAAHNRWWSFKTAYAKQNGGKYDFIVENTTLKAIPVDKDFWTDLLRESKKWGLILYEQDWLNTEFDGMKATVSDITLGRDWLRLMGQGAEKNGMPIQYCMSPSRHALQSLEIPAVTQGRASDDYQPGNDQWKIGVSSLFVHALGVAPYKDDFWTTTNQTENPYGKSEPYPTLQAAVATLSTGPVGPSDKLGGSDAKLIMRSCNADGLILKPDKPARAVDQQILKTAFLGFTGEVWTTHTNISGYFFGIILGADFSDQDLMTLTPFSAGFEREGAFPKSIIFSHTVSDKAFNLQTPLVLQGCTKKDFCLYYTTPVFIVAGEELVLYGEMDKWVPMSRQRIRNIEPQGNWATQQITTLLITLQGAVGEEVVFYARWGTEKMEFKCTIPLGGSSVIDVAARKCRDS